MTNRVVNPHDLPPPEVEEIRSIVEAARPIFAGKHPACQSAALAELLALWLAGHPNFMRDSLLAKHDQLVRDLITPCERELFGGGGHPQNTGDGGPASAH